MMELAPLDIWKDAPHLGVKKLWAWLTNYCYLPRLADQSVLEATIKDGVDDMFPHFAYATGVDEAGKYSGLKLGQPFTLYFDDKALIVEPEVARKQLPTIDPPPPPPNGGGTGPKPPPTPDPTPKLKTRYYGSVQVDPQRARRDLSQIADEVILRLTSIAGASVSITVEIEGVRGEGFDDAAIRAISENSRTLNFKAHSFEE